ncbi:MAG: hypothetical protein JRF65_02585 [Deltaproteobacteria bacterium]|nr:hypothetical protein [Deltaproteobacteria bacterium]
MKKNRWKQLGLFLITGMIVVALGACAAFQPAPKATLKITPDKTVLTPGLLKKPIVFSGSGFEPNEIVVIEMLLPKGVTVKGVPEGENAALGNGTADDKGNLMTKMGAMTTLNTLFQVGWTPLIKPDFKQATPLPPGTYDVIATGMYSDIEAKATLTLLPPPKKK